MIIALGIFLWLFASTIFFVVYKRFEAPALQRRKHKKSLEHISQLEKELGINQPIPELQSSYSAIPEGVGGYVSTNIISASAVSPHIYSITMGDYYDFAKAKIMEETEIKHTSKFQIKNSRVYVDCPWCHRWTYSKIVTRGGKISAKNIHLNCQYCRRDIRADIAWNHTL